MEYTREQLEQLSKEDLIRMVEVLQKEVLIATVLKKAIYDSCKNLSKDELIQLVYILVNDGLHSHGRKISKAAKKA